MTNRTNEQLESQRSKRVRVGGGPCMRGSGGEFSATDQRRCTTGSRFTTSEEDIGRKPHVGLSGHNCSKSKMDKSS